mmetsp:Transcript_25091/g.42068  ORF Transcript_25091/g.42068 Transcript_25091/m.42068 type:complete len:129 (+) Transcript_25091:29-415(+)
MELSRFSDQAREVEKFFQEQDLQFYGEESFLDVVQGEDRSDIARALKQKGNVLDALQESLARIDNELNYPAEVGAANNTNSNWPKELCEMEAHRLADEAKRNAETVQRIEQIDLESSALRARFGRTHS